MYVDSKYIFFFLTSTRWHSNLNRVFYEHMNRVTVQFPFEFYICNCFRGKWLLKICVSSNKNQKQVKWLRHIVFCFFSLVHSHKTFCFYFCYLNSLQMIQIAFHCITYELSLSLSLNLNVLQKFIERKNVNLLNELKSNSHPRSVVRNERTYTIHKTMCSGTCFFSAFWTFESYRCCFWIFWTVLL